jgi:AcrR family transcriptional regulator
MAAAAGVSLSSLTHHFGRRDDVIRAVMEDERLHGAVPLTIMATPTGDFTRSVRDAVAHLHDGLVGYGLDNMVANGLAEGLGHPAIGPAFVTSLLEPMIGAAEQRLQTHVEAGEMRDGDTRLAALELISPVLLAVMHQRPLGGAAVRPLDMAAFCDAHAESFLRSWRQTTLKSL